MKATLLLSVLAIVLGACTGTADRLERTEASNPLDVGQYVPIDQARAFEVDTIDHRASLADILARYPNVYVGRQGRDARVLVRGCPPVFRIDYLGQYFTYMEANVLVDPATVSHVEVRHGRKNPVYAYGPTIHIYTRRRS